MTALTNFHFIRPWWLLLVPIVVGIWWLWHRQSDPLRGWRAQMDPALLEALTHDRGSRHSGLANWLLAGWLLTLIAVAGPTWRLEPSPFAEDTAPLMILLKAGDSMDRTDPAPSRIERAQLKIADLADARKGQPLGLMAYAGSAHLVLPPTRDTSVVAQMAAQVSPAVMPVPGDKLDLALQAAGALLKENGAGGSILVVADQVDDDPAVLSKTASAVDAFPIRILALTDEGTPEAETIRTAARSLNATIQQMTVDDEDVTTIATAASRASLASVAGESNRWQEAGYWLVPLLALLVALSFRREANFTAEEVS